MEELWLQTRKRSEGEARLLDEIQRLRMGANRNLRIAELQLAPARAHLQFPELGVPSRLALAFRSLNFGMAKRITGSRADLGAFWDRTRIRRMSLLRPDRIALHFLKETQLFVIFVRELARQRLEPTGV